MHIINYPTFPAVPYHFQTVTNHWLLSPVFLTGSDRVPFLGLKSIKMSVSVLTNATEIALPEALTCYFLLLLPIYRGTPVDRIMHTRLLQAINNKSGFGKRNTENSNRGCS